jgi:alkylation response protein AidB-like acyl-CoA dehydrogenase
VDPDGAEDPLLLSLTSDQEFLRDTTAKFLADQAPVAEIRRLRDDPIGFDARYWQRGAELGWTSLLVGEEHGGGSISDEGVVDLTLIAHEFGRHAAPGPLLPANIVAAALNDDPGHGHAELRAGLLAGTSIASWCDGEAHSDDRLGEVRLEVRPDGPDVLLIGTKRPVESVGGATHLLVTGRTDRGITQVVVPARATGLAVRPMHAVDLTRRYYELTFHDVRVPAAAVVGELGGAGDQVDRQRQLALVIATAESVGAMQTAFEMTVEWAFDRYSFGRPLASYQELKHRFADMKTWLEASHAIADAAARSVASRSPGADELVSAAKAYVDDYGSELIQDCIQLHGGIGLTFEHDMHLFLRRHTMNRALHGTAAAHRQRITDLFQRGPEAA